MVVHPDSSCGLQHSLPPSASSDLPVQPTSLPRSGDLLASPFGMLHPLTMQQQRRCACQVDMMLKTLVEVEAAAAVVM